MKRLGLVLGLAGGLWLAGCASAPDVEPPVGTEAPAAEAVNESAVTPAPTPRPSACTADGFSDFDFWIGTWDVFDTKGVKQGRNVISREEGGCLLLERWKAVSGSTGQSYNVYNPYTESWRQLWVSNGSLIDYVGGLDPEGVMRLEGTITYQGGATSAPFIGEWTPNADGSVTQHFEQYDVEADEWQDWFTGIYRPVSDTE